ncbi:MAG: GAF domain-containing protein [Deltaproteobacteria bacterium]|nr:GAF domain-containing protein [Deltaproteobacteria bacterium]
MHNLLQHFPSVLNLEKAPHYDLTSLNLKEMILIGAALREVAGTAKRKEEIGETLSKHLYQTLTIGKSKDPACAFVQFFHTECYSLLSPDCRAAAEKLIPKKKIKKNSLCMCLHANEGMNGKWNDLLWRKCHTLPLDSHLFTVRFQVLSQLVSLLQLERKRISGQWAGNFKVLHITNLAEIPYYQKHSKFIASLGIRSAVAFGGLLPSGKMFAFVLYLRTEIPARVSKLFEVLALNVRMALLPFDKPVRFGKNRHKGTALDPELMSLLQLLQAHEQAVFTQCAYMESALENLEYKATDLQQSQDRLFGQTLFLQSVLERLSEAIFIADNTGRMLMINQKTEEILGIGLSPQDPSVWSKTYGVYLKDKVTLCATDDLPLVRAIKGFETRDEILFIRNEARPNGLWVNVNGVPLGDAEGNLRGGLVVVRDVTEEMASQKRLAAQFAVSHALENSETIEEVNRKILTGIGEAFGWDAGALWYVSKSEDCLECAQWWQAAHTRLDAFGQATRSLRLEEGEDIPGRVWQNKMLAWTADLSQSNSFRRIRWALDHNLRGVVAFPVQVSSKILGVIEFFATEIRPMDARALEMLEAAGMQIGQFVQRKRAEKTVVEQHAQIAALSRLIAMGEIATSVAHEISRPLALIYSDSHKLQKISEKSELPTQQRAHQVAATIGENVERIKTVMHSLLDFAKGSENDPLEKATLGRLMQEVLDLCRYRFETHSIDLLVTAEPADISLECRTAQIRQALAGLLENAYDAVKKLAVKWVKVDAREKGSFVEIRITDSGKGIKPEAREKLFTTFYSTKAPGTGRGVGLRSAREIAEKHGGTLVIDTENPNTSFVLSLPKTSLISEVGLKEAA